LELLISVSGENLPVPVPVPVGKGVWDSG
jgi:hypothetical protein